MLNLNKTGILFFIQIVAILLSSCTAQKVNFDYSGRLVLYSSSSHGEISMILLNIDTNEEIKFDDKFDEIELSSFFLFNNGKSILVNSFAQKQHVYIYDIVEDKIKDIEMKDLNDNITGRIKMSIVNDDLYYSFSNKLFIHSLNDLHPKNEYTLSSDIIEYAIYDDKIIAVILDNYKNYPLGKDKAPMTPVILYNLVNNIPDTLKSMGIHLTWSKDKRHLAFRGNGALMLMEYPSLKLDTLQAINQASLEIYQEKYFIDDDDIVFAGAKKSADISDVTNLYMLNIKTGNIKQLTNTNSAKIVRSTYY